MFKKYPNLFANGEFRFKDPHGWKWQIVGVVGDMWMGHIEDEEDTETFKIEFTKLIARPIEDLTDEERRNIWPKTYSDLSMIIKRANNDDLTFREVRELADRGAYFGPQTHFQDGKVISKAELKTEQI